MESRIAVLIATVLLAVGCQPGADISTAPNSDDSSSGQRSATDEMPSTEESEENRERIESIQEKTRELELKYREQLSDAELKPGAWRFEDGVKVCTGYLTQVEDQDYCAADVPPDWQPFEFDGRTYYFQPLSRRFEES